MHVPFEIRHFLDRAVAVYGERTGIVDEPTQPAAPLTGLTYARIGELARAQAAGLDELGVGFGERVAIASHNSARLLGSFFGVAGHGRVLVPINFRLSTDEVAYIVEDSGARVLLVDPDLEDQLKGVPCDRTIVLGSHGDQEMYRFDAQPAAWEPDEGATATINYTSGTTARPKGVELTHRNIWVNAVTFAMHLGANDRDVYLHTLPMFHANGWGMPFALTGVGAQHIVLRQVDGAEILRRIDGHGVTVLCAAPAVVSSVLAAAADWEGEIPGRGRVRIVVAGAPPPPPPPAPLETQQGWELVKRYGLTETSPLLTINRGRAEWDDLDPQQRAAKLGRAGAPAIGVAIGLSDDGEVLARSNVVLKKYWNKSDETAAALRDGWFHTGDGGRISDDGYLAISDRRKDVIITGGENVSSIEVEDTLFDHPAVAEVAVIGVPDEKWGETIRALVVLAPGQNATEADLIEHCKSRLARYKAPTSVEFRDELARTATGKLQKFKLREPFWKPGERQVN
ncbi:MAG: AMP-binding protein [Pseudonocardia sp.]|nr:AMP-binding protein [Pseudonocardia sp.]